MRIVVQEWERVLVHRDGRFERELGPGRHRLRRWRRRRTRVSVRPRLLVVPAQEVLTADGLAVKVGLTATVRVAEARRWHETVDDPEAFVYTALQLALREATSARALDELLTARASVGEELGAGVGPVAAEVGLAVDRVAVRDLMVPAELRRAAAETAAVRAQGLASLERARAEVAALRAMSNAASMLDSRPGLLMLRTLQAVESGGATLVLHAPAEPTA